MKINKLKNDKILNLFKGMDEPNWMSDNELEFQLYERQKNYDNCEKMKIVRANRKSSMSGIKKPKGIEEWL